MELCRPTSLLKIGEPDAVAVARDLFEDREGAAERLDADALPVVGVVVDVVGKGPRRGKPGDLGLRRRRHAGLGGSFDLGAAVSTGRPPNGVALHTTI